VEEDALAAGGVELLVGEARGREAAHVLGVISAPSRVAGRETFLPVAFSYSRKHFSSIVLLRQSSTSHGLIQRVFGVSWMIFFPSSSP
jgi:hypothetical protein